MTFSATNQPPATHPGRPCKPRVTWNAKRQLALDLSVRCMLSGPDDKKATRIYMLPLMQVAMAGKDAVKGWKR